MGIVNDANISDDQYYEIERALLQIMRHRDRPVWNLIHNISRSAEQNNDILIVNGVHFDAHDHLGPYHFNVKIRNRGHLEPTIYHVYVQPVLLETPNAGIEVSEDGTVNVSCATYWSYDFVYL